MSVKPSIVVNNTETLAYLATPYSKFPGGIDQAFVAAAELAARLMTRGLRVYSPIAHCHPIAIHGGIDPHAHDIWLPFDELMMQRCDTLLVALLPSWEISKGVAAEIEYFERADKPIFDLSPGSLFMRKRNRTHA